MYGLESIGPIDTQSTVNMIDKLAHMEQRYEEINLLIANPEISSDYSSVQRLVKEQASIKNLVMLSRTYRKIVGDLQNVRGMLENETDHELITLAKEELTHLEEHKCQTERELELALLPKDPNDRKNVILELRAGTGGEEAGLFTADLFKMYSRHAQDMGWKVEVVDANETGIGGIKEIIFQIKGDGAYSRLKHESGTHRVQRIPATESGGRIHTSAATVAVLPEAEEVDVDIKREDLQIDIFHASGHGGQNVQKVATAVRMTHIPSGITASCQDERSQLKNKEKALSVLRSRLLAQEMQRQQEEVSQTRRSQIGSGDRSERVRTYNFPQNRVTDHRVSVTSHNLEGILNGDIGQFINALIEKEQADKLGEAGL